MNSKMLTRALTLLALASSSFAQQAAQVSGGGSGSSRGPSAPEIDVALTGAAVALVLGGVFLLTTARRKKLASS